MSDFKLLIDETNSVAGFDDWFDVDDVEKIAKALSLIGFEIDIEKVDYEFSDYPNLAKRERGIPIPKTARNIYLILSNLDKSNDEILKILGIEREKGSFVISTMGRTLQGQYLKWQKIDHPKEWANDDEKLKAFAGYFESVKKISDKGIERSINKMISKGCRRKKENKFPECKDKFNKNCLSCQFGKDYLKSDVDIDRFNGVFNGSK